MIYNTLFISISENCLPNLPCLPGATAGFLADCSAFYRCADSGQEWKLLQCDSGLAFDVVTEECLDQDTALCEESCHQRGEPPEAISVLAEDTLDNDIDLTIGNVTHNDAPVNVLFTTGSDSNSNDQLPEGKPVGYSDNSSEPLSGNLGIIPEEEEASGEELAILTEDSILDAGGSVTKSKFTWKYLFETVTQGGNAPEADALLTSDVPNDQIVIQESQSESETTSMSQVTDHPHSSVPQFAGDSLTSDNVTAISDPDSEIVIMDETSKAPEVTTHNNNAFDVHNETEVAAGKPTTAKAVVTTKVQEVITTPSKDHETTHEKFKPPTTAAAKETTQAAEITTSTTAQTSPTYKEPPVVVIPGKSTQPPYQIVTHPETSSQLTNGTIISGEGWRWKLFCCLTCYVIIGDAS